jgi:hypothetical protein
MFAGGGMRWSLLAVVCIAAMMAVAPIAWTQEDALHADFRRESERVSDACKDFSFKAIPGCAIELFTDHPLHIAAGSMPAQNGFGLGGAFVWEKNTTNWRMNWDVDAVGSTNGSWRGGGYMKLVHTPAEPVKVIKVIVPQPGEAAGAEKPAKKPRINLVHPYSVFNLYAQSISLNKLNYFGLGNDTTLAGTRLSPIMNGDRSET